ncbi:hypothetical protein RB195_009886 [Necator americanus]|uniref:C2 NT-type domain-containing protein n=1 Tax=Necator americanus TaxID=51031 RepID=A0ABR1CWT7_NECAM
MHGRLMRTDRPHRLHVQEETSTPPAYVAGFKPFNARGAAQAEDKDSQISSRLCSKGKQSPVGYPEIQSCEGAVAFDSDHRQFFLNLKIRFHKRNGGISSSTDFKIDMAGLNDEAC